MQNINPEDAPNTQDAQDATKPTKSSKLTPVISIIDLRQNRVGEDVLRMNPKVNHHWRGDLSTARELLAIAEKLRIPESMCAMLAIHEKAERMGLAVPAVRPAPIAPIASPAPAAPPESLADSIWTGRPGEIGGRRPAPPEPQPKTPGVPASETGGHVAAASTPGMANTPAMAANIPGMVISQPSPGAYEMEYWPEAEEEDDTLGAVRD